MVKLLDGRVVADDILENLKNSLGVPNKRPPSLEFILVGSHSSSKVYVEAKKKRCHAVGVHSKVHALEESVSTVELTQLIDSLNQNPSIDGILVQLPLPQHIDKNVVIQAIDPGKDVDGFHPVNLGKLLLGSSGGFTPCTPLGIVELLKKNRLSCEGKRVVIVGRSNIVGKPLAALLIQNKPGLNATVTIAHSKTPHLEDICKEADLLVAAIGSPEFIKKNMVKKGAIVIDVGINRLADGRIVGDVDFDDVAPSCSYITPVPGGVGPMTIAMLLHNTWISYQRTHQI